jgi:hypothetical protein
LLAAAAAAALALRPRVVTHVGCGVVIGVGDAFIARACLREIA